jgi:septal ring factor EnvC (AmiA/AmiB activator)
MSTVTTKKNPYQSHNDLEQNLAFLKVSLSSKRSTVEELESTVAGWQKRRATAEELLALAERGLAEPGPLHMIAKQDKRDAEAIISECIEAVQARERRIAAFKAHILKLEDQIAAFPHEELNSQRALEELRQRLHRKSF